VAEPEKDQPPIPISEDAVKTLAEAQRKLAEINGQINSYVSGLRHGLSVPEGWELDMQAKAFVPPNEKAEVREGK